MEHSIFPWISSIEEKLSASLFDFERVELVYPNEWRRNIPKLHSSSDRQSKNDCSSREKDYFSWFLCSHRVLDEDTDLYYAEISPHVQFFDPESGRSLVARGIEENSITKRARLLILSDPHNKKQLCGRYGYLCGCDSKRDILSKECDLSRNFQLLRKGAEWAVQNGYDGVVIRHVNLKDCSSNDLSHPVCSRATFLFRKGVLLPVSEDDPQRCQIIKYAKKFNSEIRSRKPEFPTCSQIDRLLQTLSCTEVSRRINNLLS